MIINSFHLLSIGIDENNECVLLTSLPSNIGAFVHLSCSFDTLLELLHKAGTQGEYALDIVLEKMTPDHELPLGIDILATIQGTLFLCVQVFMTEDCEQVDGYSLSCTIKKVNTYADNDIHFSVFMMQAKSYALFQSSNYFKYLALMVNHNHHEALKKSNLNTEFNYELAKIFDISMRDHESVAFQKEFLKGVRKLLKPTLPAYKTYLDELANSNNQDEALAKAGLTDPKHFHLAHLYYNFIGSIAGIDVDED